VLVVKDIGTPPELLESDSHLKIHWIEPAEFRALPLVRDPVANKGTYGHALIVAGTAGPTDLAACDRDLITSAVIAEGGTQTDSALAELWWRRLHAGEPTPGPAPTLQVTATPSKIRPVYHAVLAAVPGARAHISRFDPDGAVMFFTLDGEVAVAEKAAEAAGGWLLGARAVKLDAYLHALRAAIDPAGIMNPGTFA
jgi:hypothetical protein